MTADIQHKAQGLFINVSDTGEFIRQVDGERYWGRCVCGTEIFGGTRYRALKALGQHTGQYKAPHRKLCVCGRRMKAVASADDPNKRHILCTGCDLTVKKCQELGTCRTR